MSNGVFKQPVTYREIIAWMVIFGLLMTNAVSLLGGWNYIDHLQSQRDVLSQENRVLQKDFNSLKDTLAQRDIEIVRIQKDRDGRKGEMNRILKDIEDLKKKNEEAILDIAGADVQGDISGVSGIFRDHRRW
jgi:Tfp pilus assembly protein PilN